MANDGKIYITISDRRFGRNKAEADEQNKQGKEEKTQSQIIGDYAKHQFFSLIKQQAQQAVNYTVSNIGNFTGDYLTQQHISDSIEILSFLGGVGTAALAGFKYTGSPLGAAIAVAAVATGRVVTSLEQQYAGYVENARQNRAITQLRTRAGLNSTNNGSRGTEY